MAENSNIGWTTHTLNPWRGCQKVAPGCKFCYAEAMAKRNPKTLGIWGPNGTRVIASEAMWRQPLKWDRIAAKAGERHRVFCASLADVFEDWGGPLVDSLGRKVRDYLRQTDVTLHDVRGRLFRLIGATPFLDWQLLTKRPENIRRMLVPHLLEKVSMHISQNEGDGRRIRRRENLWLGASIAEQADADRNVPLLLACRDLASVLFLSVEPLIGPVDLSRWFGPQSEGQWLNVVECGQRSSQYGINWVIVGGESGPHARPCEVEWIRSIVNQCRESGVPCFVKQDCGRKPGMQGRIPDDLWLKEFPQPQKKE